ncbi:bacterial transcriptional activator domain-containing protein [Kribbella sp. NPDC026611]|uniref:AfsR/SARP family transcriptional regulator n=1 Tax=Kribbella sp. NPDC026611 TaxID=3154911 RepID=UPI0033DA5FAF
MACDGVPVVLNPVEQRVIAFVAWQGRAVNRTFVAASIWPDISEVRAHARLRTALWRCHRAARLLDGSASDLWLADGVRVDFREMVPRVRRLCEGDGADLSPDELSRDLLDGWYDDWVLASRERYRQLRLHALDVLCRSLRLAGRYAASLEAAMVAVEAEPLRESAHAEVIELHLAEGNVNEAVRHYHRYAKLLNRELGVPPTAALTRLLPALSC